MPNAYAQFVKEHIHQFAHLPPKERMKACAELYHKGRGTKPMPKKQIAMKKKVVVEEKGRKKTGGNMVTPTMTASGGGFWDDFKEGIEMPLALARHVIF
jgi:hypothetical protein